MLVNSPERYIACDVPSPEKLSRFAPIREGKNTTMSPSRFSRILIAALFLVILNAEGGDAQVRAFGRCSKLTVSWLNPAATAETLGLESWYVTHRTRSLFDFELHCETIYFSPKYWRDQLANATTLTMNVLGTTSFFQTVGIHGEMTTLDSNFQRWSLNFRRTVLSSVMLPNQGSSQLIILGTDGTNPPRWAVIHSCSSSGVPDATYVLSKSRFLDAASLDKAQSIMMSAGLTSTLKEAEQTICSYM